MNQNLGTAGHPHGQQPVAAGQRAVAGQQPVAGQPAPQQAQVANAAVPTQQAAQQQAQQTPSSFATTTALLAAQTKGQSTFAQSPGNPQAPSTTKQAAPGQPAKPGTSPQTQAAARPGTGVPNPHYTYNKKPPLLGVGLQRDILSLLIKIAVIAGIVLGMFSFIFGVFQYPNHTMYPAVNSGDLILFSRSDKTYFAQDLIVVSYQGELQVRRVVALSGNTVDIEYSRLVIDGATQQEEHIFTDTHRYESEIEFPLVVPEGHVFVLGDNRLGAVDSRIYGTVPIDDTQGKVISLFRRRGF